jgi:hypothetical protein
VQRPLPSRCSGIGILLQASSVESSPPSSIHVHHLIFVSVLLLAVST